MRKNGGFNVTEISGDNLGTQMDIAEKLGFDGLTHYQFRHFEDIDRNYSVILKDVVKEWNAIDNDCDIPSYLHVSIGLDANPRYKMFKEGIIKNNAPDHFEIVLRMAKLYVDNYPEQAPLITINSRNEWTETSYVETDTKNGYGYLEAVKKVLLK